MKAGQAGEAKMLFSEKLAWERRRMESVRDMLLNNGFEEVKEATLAEQKVEHIDFVTVTAGKKRTVEVKNRAADYGDLLIETLSNVERKTLGWIFTCRADYLAYVVFEQDILKKGKLLNRPRLRDWWIQTGAEMNYPRFYGRTGDLYETENRAVPWKDLPKEATIFDFWRSD